MNPQLSGHGPQGGPVTHPEGRKDNRMAPGLKWFLIAAGAVLLLFFLFPLLRTTDKDFIDPPAAPASETVGAATESHDRSS
jgi:hypothetical protein